VSDARGDVPPYEELFTRNIGFVDENEQMRLRTARVAVCGVGGMGGVIAQVLARAGVGGLAILDKDRFEPSNNNRQVYAHAGTWGRTKVEVTAEELARVNPALEVRAFDHFGADNVAAVLEGVDVAVNGMDELPACLRLWRGARERGIPVVDAWSAPLPNVFVLRPEDPPPEEFLEYPTRGLAPEALTPAIVDECKLREALHVSLHTRSLRYLDFEIIKEIMTGKRARISFAPMVWGAGLMMAWEALKLRLGRGRVASRFGRFWDPWRGDAREARGFSRVELAIIKRALALRARLGA
jgi:molybdopterin/thiamine biosynthesis adenylyltransferase